MAKHFIEAGHKIDELKFTIIDHVPKLRSSGDRTLLLKRKELKWIFKLNTLTPSGLNIEVKVLPDMCR